jgi:multimeric flavodoxin WrbA
MRISIINGSPRKNGATGLILTKINDELYKINPNLEIKFYNLSELSFKDCLGCEKCYQTGTCSINDGFEDVICDIKKSDGIIIGSPTHGGNVSAILKKFMDRGHFIVEQSLYGRPCFSVATYEIADGKSTLKMLNKFFIVSGGILRNSLLIKTRFNENPLHEEKYNRLIIKNVNKFYNSITKSSGKPLFQYILNDLIVVNLIWAKYFKKYPSQFEGIMKKYREYNIHSRLTNK